MSMETDFSEKCSNLDLEKIHTQVNASIITYKIFKSLWMVEEKKVVLQV